MRPQILVLLSLFLLTWIADACAPTAPGTPTQTSVSLPTASAELPGTPSPAATSGPASAMFPCLTPTPFFPRETLATATYEPTPTDGPLPTFPPTDPRTPAADWSTYRDPDFGISFDYPSNWHLDLPPRCQDQSACFETTIDIRNYNLSPFVIKGNRTPEMLGIRILTTQDLARCRSLDNWFQEQLLWAKQSGARIGEPKRFAIDGIQAIRYKVVDAPGGPDTDNVVLGKGDRLYHLWATPVNSLYISTFDRLVDSFRVP